jgi:hypothetical protein
MENCTKCKGSGIRDAYKSLSGEILIEARQCYRCKGAGKFEAPNWEAIKQALIITPKKGTPRLRSAKPKEDMRSAYVWRMARFHGGIDMTLPVMASMDIDGDPFVKQLDTFADYIAKTYLGTDLAGAARWGKALGII